VARQPLPALARPIRVVCPPAGHPTGAQRDGRSEEEGADVAPDGTFAIDGLIGERDVRVAFLPPGWRVESLQRGSADLTEPIAFAPGQVLEDLVIAVAPLP
jgi:hypothetical protein